MRRATIPADDPARLCKLDEYSVLDTPPDSQFDAVARLAAMVLDVPIALVSIVDGSRQWFKARYGLAAAQTARDISFCGHVVATRVPLIVPDATHDVRFADNPLVVGEPYVRFYAGMPLTTPDGFVLGTLCTIDHRPREISALQQDALRLLADQAVALLELRRTGDQLRRDRQALADRERQLADRERSLQTVFDGMIEGVVVQAPGGAILRHNHAASTILGLSPDQLLGRSSLDPRWRATRDGETPFPGEDHPAMVTLRTGQPLSDVLMCVHQPGGERRWLSINSRPLTEPGQTVPYAAITTFRDVTDQREMAERLAHHQRLATVGTLAAGVGHEINNPLTYVLSNLDFAIEDLEQLAAPGDPGRPDADAHAGRMTDVIALLERAREGGERVRGIARGLRALARESTELIPADVNAIVRTAIQVADHELRTRATVRLELADAAIAQTNEPQLAQVLLNLLINAAEAFESSDTSRNQILVRTRIDRAVTIDVIDNGRGIAPEILPRIFDPFFTTKSVGVNIGLGLAIAHGAIIALGGELGCDTQLGHGTAFHITLPRAASPPAAAVEPAPAPVVTRHRVLVVDDEPMILSSFARLLAADFEVVTCADPRNALRCVQDGQIFDVVFCDMSMPYLTGMDLYAEISATRPHVAARMVFVSGDLTRDDIQGFLARVPNERIEKPFSFKIVRAIARRYLDAADATAHH